MAKQKTIRVAVIEELGRTLDALPKRPPEALPAEAAIRMLARKIADAQAKGHDLKAIVALFAQRGIALSESTLRACLRPTKRPAPRAATVMKSDVDIEKKKLRDKSGDAVESVVKGKV